jgi:hypothetical protein
VVLAALDEEEFMATFSQPDDRRKRNSVART